MNTHDTIFTNLIDALGIPVKKTDGTVEWHYFTIGERIGARGQTTDLTTVDAPHLNSTTVDTITVSAKTTYTFTGFFSPKDPVNRMWATLGWDGAQNVSAKLLTVMAQDAFAHRSEVGTFQAIVTNVMFTPKKPAGDAGQALSVEVEMSQSGERTLTYAKLDATTERWSPTDEIREAIGFQLYMDDGGKITFDPPSMSMPSPQPPEGEPEGFGAPRKGGVK